MTIHLNTFGGLRAQRDGEELEWLLGQRLRVALFVYLAIERRVSRESVTTVFWPESSGENARHALRQSLYHLRKALGEEWLEAGPHELRVSADVRTDVHAFLCELERGAADEAVRLYTGFFLEGVNLADLQPWESWVDARRLEYARCFRAACRDLVEARRGVGDLAGALEAARHWVAPDPLDDEAQHQLIRALAEAGERAEALQQYEAYARLLEADGLRPLDTTLELVEQLRNETAASPALQRADASPLRPTSTAEAAAPERPLPVRPSYPQRQLTGRRARRGGLVALGLLAVLTAGYVASREAGIGPAGSLIARGALEEGERIVLADFGSTAADPELGAVVTDALRIDLLESRILRMLEPLQLREILDRMQVQSEVPLTAELAREIAIREGVKAVLEGEVARAGSGYVLTAILRAAESGESLAAFRETARHDGEVIAAIDRLSRRIRQRAGESLRSIHATPPLERVTTTSLDALRLFSQATRAFDRGDYRHAVTLLEETVELDPGFAKAWRRLAVAVGNLEVDRVRELQAATRAYELRDRLSPRERYLAVARYHGQITRDYETMIEAYRRVLEIDPHDRAALNNLGMEYLSRQEYETAAEILERAVAGSGVSAQAFVNLTRVRIGQGRLDDARRTVDAFAERYPDNPQASLWRFWVLLLQGDEIGARSELEPLLAAPTVRPVARAVAHDHLARAELARGRIGEARRHLEEAERIGSEVGASYRLVRRLFRAHAEVAVGNPDRGIRLLRQAAEEGMLDELPPANQWHFFRAIVFAMAGLADEAEAVLRSFAEEVPLEYHDQFHIRNESARALVHLQRGDPAGAIRILEQIRASRACSFCYAERLGWALWEAGRLEEAAREWETAVAGKDHTHSLEWQFTQNLWVLQRLPALYAELGDTATALAHYHRLVEFWADADAELQPSVRHARERIAALGAGR
jgi:eukaryotic-like serine/threonine-protein kinase